MYEKLPTVERKFTLEEFIEEVERLRSLEGVESGSVHLEGIDPSNLDEEDKKMYEKFLTIKNKEDLKKYIDEFRTYREDIRINNKNQDKKDFAAFLGNMAMSKMGELIL